MADGATEEIVDLAFRLPGGRLPVDHAYALFTAITAVLPWFAEEAAARLHQVHTAATGSGWTRPEGAPGEELHLSQRTKLTLRIPERRITEARALSGRKMFIDTYPLTPGTGKVVPLMPAATLLARYVVCEIDEDESRLVPRIMADLHALGVEGATLICGRSHRIDTPQRVLHTRSLVVANLDPGGAMCLLRNGIGPDGKLGCGVFVPYKRIE